MWRKKCLNLRFQQGDDATEKSFKQKNVDQGRLVEKNVSQIEDPTGFVDGYKDRLMMLLRRVLNSMEMGL